MNVFTNQIDTTGSLTLGEHANIKCLTLMVWSDGGDGFFKEWILWESMPTSIISYS